MFAESPSVPGVPVVYRLPEDKQENPEILNLSRCGGRKFKFAFF